jgi:hypothetical protein
VFQRRSRWRSGRTGLARQVLEHGPILFACRQDDIMPMVEKLNAFVVRRADWLVLLAIAYSNGGTLAALQSLLLVTGMSGRARPASAGHTASTPAA